MVSDKGVIPVLFSRRQHELVLPHLFEAAHSGNKDFLFHVLQNGDDVNPLVGIYLVNACSHFTSAPPPLSVGLILEGGPIWN